MSTSPYFPPAAAAAGARDVRDTMKFDRIVVEDGQACKVVQVEVEVVRDAATRMVKSVMGQEFVAAICELTQQQASDALTTFLNANPLIKEVYFKIFLFVLI